MAPGRRSSREVERPVPAWCGAGSGVQPSAVCPSGRSVRGMNILWLKTELLHPVNRGGRIRTFNMLRALRQSHRITYLTLDDGTGDRDAATLASEYCDELDVVPFQTTPKDSLRLYGDLLVNLFSRLPYAMAKYSSVEMRRRVERRVAEGGYDVLVCDFLAPSLNVPRELSCPTVLFQHNVEAAIWERHTKVASSPVRRWYFGEQWRRMKRIEGPACRRFDHVIAVSEADVETLRRDYGLDSVSWIPTGVDVEYFRPSGDRLQSSHELVFTGALDWLPNEDAIQYFVDSILPLVQSVIPDVRITIVGRNPTMRIRQLAKRITALNLVGPVPDVRPYLERASVFVVPIRIGGGTRLKIYEALAMDKPVVTTSVGAEGLPISHGVHALFADGPQAFADAVVSLLREPDRAAQLARAGGGFVREEFDWNTVADAFAETCVEVVGRKATGRRLNSAGEYL